MLTKHVRWIGALSLIMAATAWAQTVPAAEAWKIGWPTMTGPTANRLPLRSDSPLVDDLAAARLLWVSKDNSLGSAKTGSQTWANSTRVEYYLGPDNKETKGNWAGVVVADGRVFGSSWLPAGKVYTAPYKTNKPYQKGETEKVPTRFRVEADDVVVCYDANNGAVLWKAVEPGGLIVAGGKRGGLQVAMAIDNGRAFSLGSTGRLFAYDAATGKKLWQGDVGPAHKNAEAAKKEAIETAEKGTVVIPDGVEWFTSLVVADGILVTGDYLGAQDVGLRGYDAATGQLKWTLPKCISQWSTPNVWRHNGKAYLLMATNSGTMRLVDPQNGKSLWQVNGLGKNWNTLSPGENTVLVNVKADDPKANRLPGIWGAYRITPEKAELAWQLPDEPQNHIPTWMDTGARQFAAVREGKVLLATEGSKADKAPGRALLLDEKDGKVLAEAPDGRGLAFAELRELILWTGDRAYVREDHSHGPNHGGRHPLIAWVTEPGQLAPILQENRFSGLDLVDFDTAYEVLMHVPLVDGRMFERTDDGRVACYDLRRPAHMATWAVTLDGAMPGMPPLPLRVWTDDKTVTAAKVWIPDSEEAAMPLGTVRRRAMWEMCDVKDLKLENNTITGTMQLGFGTHKAPIQLKLQRDGDKITGTWSRTIPALAEVKSSKGTLLGQTNTTRGYPTPWLKDRPWTPAGKNPPGAMTLAIGLDAAITLRDSSAGLNLLLDHDGKTFTRAGANAFRYSQSWHEVDASQLTLKDNRITGKINVIINKDVYLLDRDTGGPCTAGVITIVATINNASTITGTYEATWGDKLEISGKAAGSLTK